MTDNSKRIRMFAAVGLGLILLIGAFGWYSSQNNSNTAAQPGNSGSNTHTAVANNNVVYHSPAPTANSAGPGGGTVDNSGGSSNSNTGDSSNTGGSSSGYQQPQGVSGEVWQTLWVTDTSGSYWYNAPEHYTLGQSVFGSPNGVDYALVKSLNNAIYMKLSAPDTVDTWDFSCQETIYIADSSGHQVKIIADTKTVTASGQSAPLDSNVMVTQAWITGDQLGSIVGLGAGSYYWVISLTNINLNVMLGNGATQTLTVAGYGNDNVLMWPIQVK